MTSEVDTSDTSVQRGTLHLSGIDPQQPLQHSFILLMAALGLLWVVLGIFSDSPLSRYGHIGLGLVLLLTLAYMKWFYQPKYLRFDQDGLSGLLKGNDSLLLNWEAIDQLSISSSTLTITPQKGVDIELSLGQLPYAQHKDLLPQLKQVARRNGVQVDG